MRVAALTLAGCEAQPSRTATVPLAVPAPTLAGRLAVTATGPVSAVPVRAPLAVSTVTGAGRGAQVRSLVALMSQTVSWAVPAAPSLNCASTLRRCPGELRRMLSGFGVSHTRVR